MTGKFDKAFLASASASAAAVEKFKSTASILSQAERMIDRLPADRLIPFRGHPKVRDTPKLHELADSIAAHGILTPLQVRVHPDQRGSYEILAGYHRYAAGELTGLAEYPCMITDADDDTAALIVAESNKQNGFADLLPSEIAWALKIEYEALKHQGKRMDLLAQFEVGNSDQEMPTDAGDSRACSTSVPVGQKLNSRDEVGQKSNLSATSVNRYIRLNYLLPPLIQMVDNYALNQKAADSAHKQYPAMPVRAGEDISYLPEGEQQIVLDVLETANHGMDMKKSEKLREYSRMHRLNKDTALLILSGAVFEKPVKPQRAVKIPIKKMKEYLPADLASERYEGYVLAALKFYQEYGNQLKTGLAMDLES